MRTWERRYGFPSPRRSPGGHRLYSPEIVEHLERVAQALDAGHRPQQVVALSPEDLDRLIGPLRPAAGSPVDDWLELARRLDDRALLTGFRRSCTRRGALAFLAELVEPFLRRLGAAWRQGELSVYQEHQASQVLRDFLAEQWRPMSDGGGRGPIVLAGLPGEQHAVALHMVALVVAGAGWRVAMLGPDTPLAEIASCARQHRAEVVGVSISAAARAESVEPDLLALRRVLPASTQLLLGGAGAPAGLEGIQTIRALERLARWAAC